MMMMIAMQVKYLRSASYNDRYLKTLLRILMEIHTVAHEAAGTGNSSRLCDASRTAAASADGQL